MKLRSIDLFDYKSFPRFTISARDKNVLVGPNNAGKSTALDSLRIAFDVLRYASRRSATFKNHPDFGVCSTYKVPHSVVQTDLRYCVHNFADVSARIHLTGGNGNKFVMRIDPDSDIECFLVSDVPAQKNSNFLKAQFPLEILVVPTLSPLEQNEELVRVETVERNKYSRLASRNFRNFWLHRTNEEFEAFADLVELGWPGVRIQRPEIERGEKSIVRMYFREGPNVREVQWAGFGFQVWMQTMMHLAQADQRSVLVLDEPDIYLHPDLQHRLLRLVSKRVGQYFIATHSTELINDVDAGDVLIVRPTSRAARRIKSDGDYPEIYSAIGSSENAQFARLARTRKVLYFEGGDRSLLAKLARLFGGIDYISEAAVTIMRTDGFSNWGKVSTTSWVFSEFFEIEVLVAALFDRDYRCDAEVAEFISSMAKAGTTCFVLPFKELENVLLVPSAMRSVVTKYSLGSYSSEELAEIDIEFDRIILSFRDEILGQRIGHQIRFELLKSPNKDTPTIASAVASQFTADWKNEHFRRSVVPGKAAFAALASFVKDRFKVTLTAARIADELTVADVDPRLFPIIGGLKDYFADQ